MSKYFQAVIEALIIAALSAGRLNKYTALLLEKSRQNVLSFAPIQCQQSSERHS